MSPKGMIILHPLRGVKEWMLTSESVHIVLLKCQGPKDWTHLTEHRIGREILNTKLIHADFST